MAHVILLCINSLNAKAVNCHDIETSQFICSANQLTVFYMMQTLAFNKLNKGDLIKSVRLNSLSLNTYFFSVNVIIKRLWVASLEWKRKKKVF